MVTKNQPNNSFSFSLVPLPPFTLLFHCPSDPLSLDLSASILVSFSPLTSVPSYVLPYAPSSFLSLFMVTGSWLLVRILVCVFLVRFLVLVIFLVHTPSFLFLYCPSPCCSAFALYLQQVVIFPLYSII